MAKTNIEAGNLHSAAILICAVVEKHLRNLCLANDISTINELVHSTTLKKPLQLNGEAYKKKLYDRQQNRKIISWFELRDGAEPTTVNDILVKQLESMHADVTKFILQTPY